MKVGIVVCARLKSRRAPAKIATEINGKSILHHLHSRLVKTGLPLIYAVPNSELREFTALTDQFEGWNSKEGLFVGHDEDPLARLYHTAKTCDFDLVVRVTHDKIFVDTDKIFEAIDEARRYNLHYVYGSGLVPGTGFEIISQSALEAASLKFKNVEHVSYAIKAVTDRQKDLWPRGHALSDYRLLIDFPEDIELMRRVFGILGNDCSLEEVKTLLLNNPWLRRVNQMPIVTVYTCAYNAEKWIDECMGSVSSQADFADHEYILVDDCSTDRTALKMAKFASIYRNVRYIRNAKNIGLASSSNVALEHARGEYVVRLDADDYFTHKDALDDLMTAIISQNVDVIYPSNYYGKRDYVQMGKDQHHVGGAMFRTRALNHIKFTDGLRGFEGFDLFSRAQNMLKIGYLQRPIFMYRQHADSMSKTNLEDRARIKSEIEAKYGV